MKKPLSNNKNVSLNRQVYLKTRNNYKISFENNNIRKNQNIPEQNQQKHIRNKTEPIINKTQNNLLINIPRYFEESLQILHTIQHYVTMSAENNNKSLKKEKVIQKKKKSVKNNINIKLTSNQKFDMAKNIIDDSNDRKQTYSKMFNMINSSIDEIKEILLYNYKNSLFKDNYYEKYNIKNPVKEIIPFQDDISSITLYNFSESDITETKLIKETPKKEEEKNTLKISKNDESSTIINDDSYSENKNLIQINSQQFQNQLNKGNTPNLSTVISTSNTNPNTNLYPNEKLKNKKIYTEGNNNNEQNKKNQLEKINELSRKYSQDESENEKKECNIF